eukprot:GHVP01065490.1.p1 GENE.GHVP01065490.1~~GHVP01065490.1.p1  ORF type:complete len:1923 (+),score=368.52 GHVP01065490.1:822-5771(+)
MDTYSFALQDSVNALIDSTKTKSPNPIPGVRQWMEKKQGAIRQRMMGKRVNFAARTVIAPDCNIRPNEIGIPVQFAMKLSMPELVNDLNLEQMRKIIIRGDQYPGASKFKDGNGRVFDLTKMDKVSRQSKARLLTTTGEECTPVVLRHVVDGDFVLMNRQPTLHKPGIMAHSVKVLQGERAFRMHYANCNTYNADFDGDEMNLHLPQDLFARAESKYIVCADNQYHVPKNGDPLRGLMQDHVLGGAFLSCRGTFLEKNDYCRLVYEGIGPLSDNCKLARKLGRSLKKGFSFDTRWKFIIEPPAIMKPQKLWTGKQVITSIIKNLMVIEGKLDEVPNLTFESKSKTPGNSWNGVMDKDFEEEKLLIRHCECLRGVFDKNQFGPTNFGFVHYINEIVGPSVSGKLIGLLGRVFTMFLRIRGFSFSLGDFLLTESGENDRMDMINSVSVAGTSIQEFIVDSMNSVMKWKEELPQDSAVDAEKLKQLSNELPFIVTDAGSVNKSSLKLKYSLDGRRLPGRSMIKSDSLRQLNEESRTDIKSSFWIENLGHASNDIKKAIDALKKEDTDKKTSDWRTSFVELMSKDSRLSTLFPKTAELLNTDHLWHWNSRAIFDGGSYKGDAVSYDLKTINPVSTVATPNLFHRTLGRGLVLGDGSKRTPILYTPSYCWQGTEESKILLQKRTSYLEAFAPFSGNQGNSKLYIPLPNELTRIRVEAIVRNHFSGKEMVFRKISDSIFQAAMSKVTAKNNDVVSGGTTLIPFPTNGFASMVTTGAKGSKVNFAMICSMLSQQSLEGKRVPLMVSGASLPCFANYDFGARAGGLITDRYLDGLRPPEYFFHCMAGREGLVDTAVKTSRSGYLQRCIIKGLEGLCVQYDGTVRNVDGSIVQFLYGEDGIDPLKTTYLFSPKTILKNVELLKLRVNFNSVLKSKIAMKQLKNFRKRESAFKANKDPLLSEFPPTGCVGSVSEKYRSEVMLEILKDVSKDKENLIDMLLRISYQKCTMQPGEAVGCLAAQSIGEPATQMTLNTFHLAGHGAANVTLGIPRLRELLQTSGSSKTPVIAIPVVPRGSQTLAESITTVMDRLRNVPLTDVINSIGVDGSVYYQPENAQSTFQDFSTRYFRENPPDNISQSKMKRYWLYETTIQCENLEHFCEILPAFEPQDIINLLLNRVVPDMLKIALKEHVVSSMRVAEEESGLMDDDMDATFAHFVVNRRVRTSVAKRIHMKERIKIAGTGFGRSSVSNEMDFLTGSSTAGLELKNDSGEKDQDNSGDETKETKETKNRRVRVKDGGEKGASDSDEQDDSEEDYTDSDIGDDAKQESMEDDSDEEESPRKRKLKLEEENEEDEERASEMATPKTKKLKKENKKSESEVFKAHKVPCWVNPRLRNAMKASKPPADDLLRFVKDLKFDVKTWKLTFTFGWDVDRCPKKLSLLKPFSRCLKKHFLQDTLNLKNPRLVAGENTETKVPHEIQIEGTNISYIQQLPPEIIEHSKICCNDIQAVLSAYGIEAARRCLIKELVKVFSVYGITVDYRHLSLIGDHMTASGSYRSFSRIGMRGASSPFLQMSYETSMGFLSSAVERRAIDNLNSPAGAIIAGRPVPVGSGLCRIFSRLETEKETLATPDGNDTPENKNKKKRKPRSQKSLDSLASMI